ncbi:MAG: ABC transporter substrate-binding protein [Fibrobacterota bacterium]
MRYLFLLILSILFMSGCSDTSSPRKDEPPVLNRDQLDSLGRAYTPEIGTHGGTLKLPLGANPDNFCPSLTSSGYSMEVLGFLYEGLVTTDPVTLEKVPHIARSWDVSDDGLTWIFNLRRDVLFSDSVPLTAHDVVFTFNDVIYNDTLNSPLNLNFRVRDKKFRVTAPDSFTVRFDLPHPYAPFLTIATTPILPKHAYADAAAAGNLKSYLSTAGDPARVVGSGPFMLEKAELGQRILLKRNPHYWQKDSAGNALPYLDEVLFKIIKEPNQQMLSFQRGEIDHIKLSGKQYSIVKSGESAGTYRVFRTGPRWYNRFIKFNQNNQVDENGRPFVPQWKQKLFRNRDFRRAVAHSINYDDLINIIHNGLARKSTGIIGTRHPKWYNPEAPTYDYDPQKADSLFTHIGLIDRDGDGVREDSAGNPVRFALSVTAGVKMLEDITGMIRKDLKHRKIAVFLNPAEFNTLIERTSSTFQWDAICYALSVTEDPHFGKSTHLPNSRRYVINPLRLDSTGDTIGKTYEPWEKRIIEIFEEAVTEMDHEKRAALYKEWQAIEQGQCNSIYLPVKELILGVSTRFGNIHLTGTLNRSETVLHNPEEIYIKE